MMSRTCIDPTRNEAAPLPGWQQPEWNEPGSAARACLHFLLALVAAWPLLGMSGLLVAAPAAAQVAPGGAFSMRPTLDEDIQQPRNPLRVHAPTIRSWFTFDAAAGQEIRDLVQVTNTGAVPVDLHLYAVDATTGPTTGMVLQNVGAPRIDVGQWVEVGVDTLHLAAGEVRDVPFVVRMPPDAAAGEHWGGLIAEDLQVRKGSGQFAVDQVLRVGVALGVLIPGQRIEQLAIRGLTEKVVNNLDQVFVLDLANEGNAMVKPRGALELRDAAGNVVGRRELALDNVLPGTAVPYELFWTEGTLPAGTYRAAVTLQAGAAGTPVTLNVPALEVKAPGSRLAPAAGQQASVAVVAAGQSGGGLWQLLLAGLGGAGAVALALAGYRLVSGRPRA